MLRVVWKQTGNEAADRLGGQFVDRVARFAHGGSYELRIDKYRKYRNFLIFVGERFGPEDIRNIQPYHVAAFARYMRAAGRSDTTVDIYFSVIRWWHSRIAWRKYDIPENAILKVLEARLDDKAYRGEVKNRCRVKRPGRRVQESGRTV